MGEERNAYARLGLRDNPFPREASADPTSQDVRENGSIYNEEIFREEIGAIRERLEGRQNVIYAQNTRFVAGVGKSALITREWRRLRESMPSTTVYVRCGQKTQASSIEGSCNAIVVQLYRTGALWAALGGLLRLYSAEASHPVVEPGAVRSFVASYSSAPRKVSPRALLLYDVKPAVESIANWLEEMGPRVWRAIATTFLSTMLTEPGQFTEAYEKRARKREVEAFTSMLEFLRLGGADYLYVFLDQFEYLFQGRGKKEVLDLASSMRRILEASSGLATFVVTLHPNAARELRAMEGQSLTDIAPVDSRHAVDLPNITEEEAIRLAQTYLDRFRRDGESLAGSTSPFTEECIRSIARGVEGNIRDILQTLHYAVDVAAAAGGCIIDDDFVQRHHRDITGKVSAQEWELS